MKKIITVGAFAFLALFLIFQLSEATIFSHDFVRYEGEVCIEEDNCIFGAEPAGAYYEFDFAFRDFVADYLQTLPVIKSIIIVDGEALLDKTLIDLDDAIYTQNRDTYDRVAERIYLGEYIATSEAQYGFATPKTKTYHAGQNLSGGFELVECAVRELPSNPGTFAPLCSRL